MDKLPLTDNLLPVIYVPDWDKLQNAENIEPFAEVTFYLLRDCA